MSNHPPLDSRTLWFLETLSLGLASDPNYLEGADYPPVVAALLGRQARAVMVSEDEVGEIDVPTEVAALLKDLKETREGFAKGDNSEKMAYFRVATALLEKLISLRERANNVRQIGRFYAEVLSVMDEVLTETQVSAVRNRLNAKIEGTGV